ncbi:hypothetical protein DUNSADRAFT_12363 [Dunaliella salina]|uniref:Uncharacterized protein n=1 Tax=Dunaliella salina TaxID=3046 RepID=A0ABQ7GBF5_DUNSA|nr:hypothetical protein DUNSADRAFT_12363 [Dunaliella salina]|eukprot:KAF5831948.1 hypothetical protein DUNSADRAFT_12363 [Dunaliella salina]
MGANGATTPMGGGQNNATPGGPSTGPEAEANQRAIDQEVRANMAERQLREQQRMIAELREAQDLSQNEELVKKERERRLTDGFKSLSS